MAYKRKRPSYKRKYPVRKRGRYGPKRGNMQFENKRKASMGYKTRVNAGLGFPKQMIMKHRYSELIPLTSTGGSPSQYLFSCNGMFDPNITGTGHQPYYFDQMAALYNHYLVIGSKCKFQLSPQVNSHGPIAVTVYVNDDTSRGNNNPALQAEYQSARFLMSGETVTNSIKRTLKWSAKKTFGGSVMANTELQGTSGANPTEQSYFNIDFVAADLTSTVSCVLWVEIEYIAIWKEIQDIGPS